MANMTEILPKGEYTVKVVGPSRDWSFKGDKGDVKMATDSIQFEGHEQYWVDVNRAQDKPAPEVGAVLNGSIEQDADGKYPPKFAKERTGGGWGGGGGGGRTTPGAIWSSAVGIAAQVLAGYYAASETKPKSMAEYLTKLESVAPRVNAIVDKLVAANPAKAPATTDKTESESGESPAPAGSAPAKKDADVVIEDISDEDLGDW